MFSQKEHEYLVSPLTVPDTIDEPIETLWKSEAVQLFHETVNNGFPIKENVKTIAEICQELGGLPLGILLAASWVEQLTIDGVYDALLSRRFQELEDESYDDTENESKRH